MSERLSAARVRACVCVVCFTEREKEIERVSNACVCVDSNQSRFWSETPKTNLCRSKKETEKLIQIKNKVFWAKVFEFVFERCSKLDCFDFRAALNPGAVFSQTVILPNISRQPATKVFFHKPTNKTSNKVRIVDRQKFWAEPLKGRSLDVLWLNETKTWRNSPGGILAAFSPWCNTTSRYKKRSLGFFLW